jgi:hypothetical protein
LDKNLGEKPCLEFIESLTLSDGGVEVSPKRRDIKIKRYSNHLEFYQ